MTAEVLVLDDEAAISELLVRTLAQRGIAASSAPDADAAERRLAEDPDLLVLVSDVRMPGTDGATLAARLLAKRAEDAALEIVLMTGDALEADLPHDSVFAVVQKPFRLGEVHGVVRRALDAARQRRMAARLEAEAASAVDERAIRFAGLTRDDARAREMLRLVAEALRPGLSAALGTDGLPAPALRAVMELAGAVSLVAGPDDLRREVTTGAAVAAAAATLAGRSAAPADPPGAPELRLDLPLVACALAALLRAAGPDARLEVEADGSFRLTGWPDAPDSVPLRQAAALADAHGGALAREGAVLRLRFG